MSEQVAALIAEAAAASLVMLHFNTEALIVHETRLLGEVLITGAAAFVVVPEFVFSWCFSVDLCVPTAQSASPMLYVAAASEPHAKARQSATQRRVANSSVNSRPSTERSRYPSKSDMVRLLLNQEVNKVFLSSFVMGTSSSHA